MESKMVTKKFDCFDLDKVVRQIAKAVGVSEKSVRTTVELLDSGNTIPFIARYRKEATGTLDEIALRSVEDALSRARELADRKATILKSIDQQELLTPELQRQIESCNDKQTLESLYLPFKPKRRTRATVAREQGLQPLADLLLNQEKLNRSTGSVLQEFVRPELDVPDTQAALRGACDIVAEVWSEDAETRQWLVEQATNDGQIASHVKRGKKEAASKFEMYFDHRESVNRIPSHRFLAMKRGEAEGLLRISLELDDQYVTRKLQQKLIHNHQFEFCDALRQTVVDCYERLLLSATESTVVQSLKEDADGDAIIVFAKNLRELLLAPPAGPRVTVGIDPGFRTGCKVAVVDGTGKFLAHATIYPTPPRNDTEAAKKTLCKLITEHDVKLISIGNGTASRETDTFVSTLVREESLKDVTKVMVSESGASIYSASDLAVSEYPDLDVTVRGAISIAHRLQDPLAELVKIDPKSIGVGQYQHDVNQTLLKKSLVREVESCVNSVGVDVNLASAPLLAHVAGIGPKLAQKIVDYRDANGRFKSRQELLSVPKLGKKAFEQCAGFLRILNGRQPLDNSAVHPESYYIVKAMATKLAADTQQLVGNVTLSEKLNANEFVDDKSGLPTIQDILSELAKPGRDPRSEFKVARFAEGIDQLQDLQVDMRLEGVVTNVTKFGAFVDIGVHQDGLIHISQLADTYVADPSDIVSVGDVVQVRVLEVDLDRKRIALSRKQIDAE